MNDETPSRLKAIYYLTIISSLVFLYFIAEQMYAFIINAASMTTPAKVIVGVLLLFYFVVFSLLLAFASQFKKGKNWARIAIAVLSGIFMVYFGLATVGSIMILIFASIIDMGGIGGSVMGLYTFVLLLSLGYLIVFLVNFVLCVMPSTKRMLLEESYEISKTAAEEEVTPEKIEYMKKKVKHEHTVHLYPVEKGIGTEEDPYEITCMVCGKTYYAALKLGEISRCPYCRAKVRLIL